MEKQYHPYHMVDPSPWPYTLSFSILGMAVGAVMYFHYNFPWLLLLGFGSAVLVFTCWTRDVVREATFLGKHTQRVVAGLKMGFLLFIVSEIFLFVSLFWAFLHAALSPAIEIGALWPPKGITPLDPFALPLLNTAFLLSSGATVTWSHHALVAGLRRESLIGLGVTLCLGTLFTLCQALEYSQAPFTIADSVYGSSFFLATGFHGLHVIVGTIFLGVAWARTYYYHFGRRRHLGFEMACWYWHFVDVVWLLLYIIIYWWGS